MEAPENKLDVVSIRLVKDRPLISDHEINSPEDAVKVLGDILSELDREVMCVINLDAKNRPISCNFVSMGAVNYAPANVRDMMKSAILSNAVSMITIHNHPSGKLTPSIADISFTDRMIKACELIDIPLYDSIIVGGDNSSYFSLREKDYCDFRRDQNHLMTNQQEQTPKVRHRHR